MDNKVIHNFCESRLHNNEPPEIFNAFTSFFISLIPFIFGFPKNIYFFNSSILLVINGITSFYYHYNLNYLGKQSDEIAMILITYYTIYGLLNLKFNNNKKKIINFNTINLIFMFCFTVFNTEIYFDFLFPYLFSTYLIPLLYLVYDNGLHYSVDYKPELFLSLFGALSWIISELFCNKYTTYGHVLWHILFPLGYYNLLLKFDQIYQRLDNNHNTLIMNV
tara:strand:+ start:263 stop:925 length:663 start_codon:yes stop_codon:yes gene_type:complete